MKTKIPVRLLCLALLVSMGKVTLANNGAGSKPVADSLKLKPYLVKKNSVKLSSLNGTIAVRSVVDDNLDFYVFDLDATLMYQTTLSGKDKKVIPPLKKGIYTYDVFKKTKALSKAH